MVNQTVGLCARIHARRPFFFQPQEGTHSNLKGHPMPDSTTKHTNRNKQRTTFPGSIALTKEEAKRLLGQQSGPLAMCLVTGLRWDELAGLVWQDIAPKSNPRHEGRTNVRGHTMLQSTTNQIRSIERTKKQHAEQTRRASKTGGQR